MCGGDGIIKIEMHFLPDVYVRPARSAANSITVRPWTRGKYKGKNIYDVLNIMTVEEALDSLRMCPLSPGRYEPYNMTWDWVHPAETAVHGLSVARARSQAGHGAVQERHRKDYLYPGRAHHRTHFADVHKLIILLLHRLSEAAMVVVIEHNGCNQDSGLYLKHWSGGPGTKGQNSHSQGNTEEVAQCHGVLQECM